MRNLKKHLSVLLVLAMVFTMMAPVFAASSYNYEEEAKALYGLGLYKGISDKNFVPDLGSALTREQEAIIVLRLFGQEQEALKMSNAEVNAVLARFADSDTISSWARNQVAYATSIGVIKGIEGENGLTFNPQGALKGNDCASLLLQQLGVKDFEYFGALEKLASSNAISVAQMISFDKAQLIRDDVVGMSYGVLTAKAANNKTVIENLVEKGLVERAYAEQLGLVKATEPTVQPTVKPEMKEAKVEFIPTAAQSIATNQTLFEIGRIKVTAADKDVTLTGAKLQRTGLSADTDIETITVWNGTEKVNSIGRFSNGVANIAFTKTVTVKAGEALELSVKINIKELARVASQIRISLLEVKSDATLVGTFPMEGNVFTLAPAGLGTMQVRVSGDTPTANISAGDKDIRLAKFDIEFAREAQVLKQLKLTQEGTVSDTDLTNLKLVDEDGKVLATGELNRGEITFVFEKEYTSGSTARLTLKGDVVGGAGRTVQFSINNVNDVQSVGRTYGTTIALSNVIDTDDLKALKIEKGSVILTKAESSPAAATIAQTVDDQKFTSIKIEAVGEPIQLETIAVGIVGDIDYVTEVKLLTNGKTIASQDLTNNYAQSLNYDEDVIHLALNEVITVEPGTPVVIDIAMDIKDGYAGYEYQVGIVGIEGTGLISGKTLRNDDVTLGNKMTVGDVRVKFKEAAYIDGYIFANQSNVKIAGLKVSHNLGETVKLSSIDVEFKDGDGDSLDIGDMEETFKNIKVVAKDGTVLSSIISAPTEDRLTMALNEGVLIESGKTLELDLVGDVKASAETGESFRVNVVDATAVTVATGTTVRAEGLYGSRTVTVAEAIDSDSVTAEYSINADLKNKNIYAGDKNVKLAQWTLKNESNEEVRVNKLYLTADYMAGYTSDPSATPKPLKHAYVECVLKNDKGTVLSDTFTLENETPEEITIKTSGNKSILTIAEQKDGVAGETEVILYANIKEGAQIAGSIQVDLGSQGSSNTQYPREIMEVTGAVTGETKGILDQNVPSEVRNTIGISPIYVTSTSLANAPLAGATNETVATFKLKNYGEKTVNVETVKVKVISDTSSATATHSAITKLDIFNDGNKLDLDGAIISSGEARFTFKTDRKVKLAKGEEKEFEIKLNGTEALDKGEIISLQLVKEGTCYDNVKNEGYEISIDLNNNQDDTIKLASRAAID